MIVDAGGIKGRALSFSNLNGSVVTLACGALLAFAMAFHSLVPLTADVSYFLLADERILAGAVPYVDILETNPPLAFWITLPPVWLARILGLSSQVSFVAYVCLMIAASLAVTRLILRSAGEASGNTALLLIASAMALTVVPAEAFGQREHFATLLALPYVAAAAQLAEGRKPRTALCVLAGLLGGVGMAFKPYLLAIPMLVEAFLLWERRDWRQLFRTETLGMAGVLAAYPLLVWQFTPAYFSEIVPLALITYGAFEISYLLTLLRHPVAVFALFIGVATTLIWRSNLQRRGDWVWIAASAGGFICYLVQAKGWPYQLLPGLVFVTIPLLVNAARIPGAMARVVIFGCFAIVVIKGFSIFIGTQNLRIAYLDKLLAERKPQRIMALSYDLGLLFPFVETRGIVWSGRFQSIWTMPAVARELIPVEQRDAVTAQTAEFVAEDLNRWKPDVVIVDRQSNTLRLQGHEIKYVEWFSRSPDFVLAWSSYKLVNSNGYFEVWERQ